ncbi:MAG TPA: alpha-L-glutamate ligase [Cyanothece sp. UBA12306]|nr:alpha-L-glutamate ligase [Cyanothece sp. UBA12306]
MYTNIKFWIATCQELKINYEIVHPSGNLLKIKLGEQYYFFADTRTPFNSQSLSVVLKDKEYTYCLLKDKINMPDTLGFVNPFCQEKYQQYLTYKSLEAIEQKISSSLQFPLIIKQNSGSQGKNVFLCQKQEQIPNYLKIIFNIQSCNFDPIALAQQYIQIKYEYRAIFFDKKLVLLYKKDTSNANFIDNLSPLHWEGSKACYIDDSYLKSTIEEFVKPVFEAIPLNYGGFDIIIDEKDQYWLLEINSSPSYNVFANDNDPRILLDMFKYILIELNKNNYGVSSKSCSDLPINQTKTI